MQPLSHDIRRMFRRYSVGETVSATGDVTETYAVDGPYNLAFRPGGDARVLTEGGYSKASESYFVIADGCDCFQPGDVLTTDSHGNDARYAVQTVKTFPTEQTMYVRGLR